jgi:hypothetical protein
MEKRERETKQFANCLNQEKTYFKDFKSKFTGIAEAMTNDEESVVDSVREDENSSPSLIIKPKKVKGSQDGSDDENSDEEGSGEGESGDEKSDTKSGDEKSEAKSGDEGSGDESRENSNSETEGPG